MRPTFNGQPVKGIHVEVDGGGREPLLRRIRVIVTELDDSVWVYTGTCLSESGRTSAVGESDLEAVGVSAIDLSPADPGDVDDSNDPWLDLFAEIHYG